MSSAFRYSGQKYNDALLALGNIRVGTLHDFRGAEHKKGISDDKEGIKTVSHKINRVTEKDDGSVDAKALRSFSALKIGGENVVIEGITLSEGFDHPDCFVHCSSEEYSARAMSQFGGADSCIEIHDVEAFYARFTRTLQLHFAVDLFQVALVEYSERDQVWNGNNWGAHPAFIKEPIFAPQVELRAVWIPRFRNPIAPVVINDVELLRYCKLRDIPK